MDWNGFGESKVDSLSKIMLDGDFRCQIGPTWATCARRTWVLRNVSGSSSSTTTATTTTTSASALHAVDSRSWRGIVFMAVIRSTTSSRSSHSSSSSSSSSSSISRGNTNRINSSSSSVLRTTY